MWFNSNDLTKFKTICLDDLNGYVLPHAGTKFTGNIISHTLRFKPNKLFKHVIILFLPSQNKENVATKLGNFYHEYYVPYMSIKHAITNFWGIKRQIKFHSYNVNKKFKFKIPDFKNTLYVISADFSHNLSFQEAIQLENCAAHSILHNKLDLACNSVIDDVRTFKEFNKIFPKKYKTKSPNLTKHEVKYLNTNCYWQWIGRTMSPGLQGVGYLSFLLMQKKYPSKCNPDGIFITAYDQEMNARECLGKWFTKENPWTCQKQTNLKDDVIHKARTTSRLTGGTKLNIPVTNYTIYLLYKDNENSFIRGWHGILMNAFYLPNVFLEHTFDNGSWIQSYDNQWESGNQFNLKDTFNMLSKKANISETSEDYSLYYCNELHCSL